MTDENFTIYINDLLFEEEMKMLEEVIKSTDDDNLIDIEEIINESLWDYYE